MQYDTIMGMLFYEFQNVLETYSTILEERKKAEEKENEENGVSSKYNPNTMMKNAQNYINKSSQMANLPQMPKIDIPKF